MLLCALFLFGLGGCAKRPAKDPEPKTGETINLIDPDAPKVIKSKEISTLSISFYLATRWDKAENHAFSFEVKPDESGVLTAYESSSGISCLCGGALLESVQAVVDEEDLALQNGVYESNLSLPPEFQGCEVNIGYASGEMLAFTVINDPYALWAEKIYSIFAGFFASNGDESLYPERETSDVSHFVLTLTENGKTTQYGDWNTQDGPILQKIVYQTADNAVLSEESVPIPEGYGTSLSQILDRFSTARSYDFSRYDRQAGSFGNHEAGYYGFGSRTTADNEPDSEDSALEITVRYESDRQMQIETKKQSEIDGIRPMLAELEAYFEDIFVE